MPDLHGQLTPQGNLNGTLNTIVYASNYNVLENKPSINSVTLQGNKTASELGLATPEDITVTSVNGETGAVVLDGSDINYDSVTTINNKIDDLQSQISSSGVLAVNGKTGVVILTGADINYSAGVTLNSKIDAVESEIPIVSYPVTSVNSKTGAVVLDGSDIAYDENNTVNEKIAAVESEIPTVDYPVTSVNELTGDVSLTAGDVPLGSDFSDPTSTAGAIKALQDGKADIIATGSHTVYGVWSDSFYGTSRMWVAFPNADDYTISLTSTKYRSADTTMTTVTGGTIAVQNDCGFLVAVNSTATGHYGEIVFTTA